VGLAQQLERRHGQHPPAGVELASERVLDRQDRVGGRVVPHEKAEDDAAQQHDLHAVPERDRLARRRLLVRGRVLERAGGVGRRHVVASSVHESITSSITSSFASKHSALHPMLSR
jgi:hypothetical protein